MSAAVDTNERQGQQLPRSLYRQAARNRPSIFEPGTISENTLRHGFVAPGELKEQSGRAGSRLRRAPRS